MVNTKLYKLYLRHLYTSTTRLILSCISFNNEINLDTLNNDCAVTPIIQMRSKRNSNANRLTNRAIMPAINRLIIAPLAPYYYRIDKSSCRYACKLYIFFYGLGRAILKEGVESQEVPSSRGRTTANGGLLAIYLSQQQELQDGCLPYVNYTPRSSRSYRTAASPMSTSIAIKRQMLDFFSFLSLLSLL